MILNSEYTGDTNLLNNIELKKSNSLSDLKKVLDWESINYYIDNSSLHIISLNEKKEMVFQDIIEDNEDVFDYDLDWELAIHKDFKNILFRELVELLLNFCDIDDEEDPFLMEDNQIYRKFKENLIIKNKTN